MTQYLFNVDAYLETAKFAASILELSMAKLATAMQGVKAIHQPAHPAHKKPHKGGVSEEENTKTSDQAV